MEVSLGVTYNYPCSAGEEVLVCAGGNGNIDDRAKRELKKAESEKKERRKGRGGGIPKRILWLGSKEQVPLGRRERSNM